MMARKSERLARFKVRRERRRPVRRNRVQIRLESGDLQRLPSRGCDQSQWHQFARRQRYIMYRSVNIPGTEVLQIQYPTRCQIGSAEQSDRAAVNRLNGVKRPIGKRKRMNSVGRRLHLKQSTYFLEAKAISAGSPPGGGGQETDFTIIIGDVCASRRPPSVRTEFGWLSLRSIRWPCFCRSYSRLTLVRLPYFTIIVGKANWINKIDTVRPPGT